MQERKSEEFQNAHHYLIIHITEIVLKIILKCNLQINEKAFLCMLIFPGWIVILISNYTSSQKITF